MLNQLQEAKQKELNSIDRSIQIKRKSDDSEINENDEKLAEDDLNNKKTRRDDQNDKKIVYCLFPVFCFQYHYDDSGTNYRRLLIYLPNLYYTKINEK